MFFHACRVSRETPCLDARPTFRLPDGRDQGGSSRVTVLSPCSASRPCRPRPECRKDIVNVRKTVQGSLVLVQFRTRTGYRKGYRVRRVSNALADRELLVVFLCVFFSSLPGPNADRTLTELTERRFAALPSIEF